MKGSFKNNFAVDDFSKKVYNGIRVNTSSDQIYVQEVNEVPDIKDLKGLVDKAEDAAKKAGITSEDLEKYKDKAVDVAKDFFDKKKDKDKDK